MDTLGHMDTENTDKLGHTDTENMDRLGHTDTENADIWDTWTLKMQTFSDKNKTNRNY